MQFRSPSGHFAATFYSALAAQSDLVDVIARFDPKIVRMADAGEKPED